MRFLWAVCFCWQCQNDGVQVWQKPFRNICFVPSGLIDNLESALCLFWSRHTSFLSSKWVLELAHFLSKIQLSISILFSQRSLQISISFLLERGTCPRDRLSPTASSGVPDRSLREATKVILTFKLNLSCLLVACFYAISILFSLIMLILSIGEYTWLYAPPCSTSIPYVFIFIRCKITALFLLSGQNCRF